MSAGQVQTTGIVIRVKPYGERDKLVTLLTADRGVITVSAKGALKLTASFSRCPCSFSAKTWATPSSSVTSFESFS